ncbi:hypothetical protein GQ602_003986 [Ophiocordyceps camponoti-floridani]|uniref:Hydrophobin n=1 Tax=Ophiocordyceps camponoti-floridani TaxID=2030778 RepID=A0A8H4Q5V8_9HYPO|nr:hypothetical protein GQ602_003986 [Ophiocordyceps camponoti-floridani]
MKVLTLLLATLPLALSVENTELGIMDTSGTMEELNGALMTAEAGDKPDKACSGNCGDNIFSKLHDQAHCLVGAVLPFVKQAIFHKDCPRQYLNCCLIGGNKKPKPTPDPTPDPTPNPNPAPVPINYQQMYNQYMQQFQQYPQYPQYPQYQQGQQYYQRVRRPGNGRRYKRAFEA